MLSNNMFIKESLNQHIKLQDLIQVHLIFKINI